jgi:hypothetical protein
MSVFDLPRPGESTRYFLSWVDLDGDGDRDAFVYVAGVGAGTGAHLFRNNGGAFELTAHPLPLLESLPSGTGDWASWVDVEVDGLPELLVSGVFSGDLERRYSSRLYESDGSRFTDLTGGPLPSEDVSVVWLDYDLDGYPDLQRAHTSGGVQLYRNNSGSFQAPVVYSAEFRMLGASAADIDGDGDPDLLLPGTQPDGAKILDNVAVGTIRGLVARTPFPRAIKSSDWADYDRDGDLDLVASTSDGPSELYRNDGAFRFTRIDKPVIVENP